MSMPVTTTAPAARPTSASGGASRSSAGASPFASMLDDALSADRPAGRGPSDRGIEQRTSADDRADRAAERAADHADRAAARAADRADRAADKSERAGQKAAHRAERAAAHAAQRGGRADEHAADPAADEAGDAVVDGDTPVDPAAPVVAADAESTDTVSGLPGAVWALLMGAPVVPADATPEATAPVGGTAAVGAVAAAGVPAAATAPPSAAVAPTPAAPVESLPDAAAPASAPATTPTTTPSAPAAAEAALAGFTVVRAEDLPASAPATGLPAAAAAAVPAATTTTAVSASPAPAATVAPATDVPADAPAPDLPGPAVTSAASGAVAATTSPAPATTGTADAATTSPTSALPTAGIGAAGDAQSSGAGSSSQQGSADGGAAQAASPVVLPGTTAPAVPTVAAVRDADGATGASAAQPVGSQVARQVAVLRGGPDGAHTMTLVLTPDTLGPVEVQVTLQKGAVDLTLRGAHEHGRAALLDALPDLRRDLEAAGLSPSRLEVDRDSGGAWLDRHAAQQQAHQQAMTQQHGSGDRGHQQDRAEGRSRPWVGSADTGTSGPTPSHNRSTSSGVDYRV